MTRPATIPARATLRGHGVAPGLAIGRALILDEESRSLPLDRSTGTAIDEMARFERAASTAVEDLCRLRDQVGHLAGEACARVFQAQVLILRDPAFRREVAVRIRQVGGVGAAEAVASVLGRYSRLYEESADADLRDRGSDIADVRERLLASLTGRGRALHADDLPRDTVLVARHLSPSEAAELPRDRVAGLAMDGGGPTSHTAIVAAALGIPAVVGLQDACGKIRKGEFVAVDGSAGLLHHGLSDEEVEEWRARAAQRPAAIPEMTAPEPKPQSSRGAGLAVLLQANLNSPDEWAAAAEAGACGVGLFRSELLEKRTPGRIPSEEEQTGIYGELLARAAPHDVTIRTLDQADGEEDRGGASASGPHSVMGRRGIRLSLARPDRLKTQLRAILRAGVHGKARILLPMVSSVQEVEEARAILEEARAELYLEGFPHADPIPLGVLIEIPAAALIAGRLAERADFLAVGTNDLIQFTLAADRDAASVAHLYQPLHPAVLALLRQVSEAASGRHLRHSVCGEMAADPLHAVILAGLGFGEMSLRPAAIAAVRRALDVVGPEEARGLAEEALRQDGSPQAVASLRKRIESMLAARESGTPSGEAR